MTKYYIGMHVGFDDKKYKRDFTSDISGIEFCNFDDKNEIERMIEISKEEKFEIGIHFPLYKSNYKSRDPLLLSLDVNERLEAIIAVEKEMKYASEIGAQYLLIHFPKPMIIKRELNWALCKFPDKSEYVYEEVYPYDEFKKNCYSVFDQLSTLSIKYDIQVVLEIEMLNQYLYCGNLLKNLLEKYSNIKLCLDSARIHVLSKIDLNFDYKTFIKQMAKYTYSLHIANINVTDVISNGHYPAVKELKEVDGWFDIGTFLKIISTENKDLKVLFEHRSDILSDEVLMACYEWVMSYFK